MAYELHIQILPIKRDNKVPISLEDWKSAVLATREVRLCSSGTSNVTNPQTGEIITIQKREGEAEVYFPKQDTWIAAFRWSRGAIHFNARFNADESSNPVWIVATALAEKLEASIQGDEGQTYNLQTGKPNTNAS